jgi:hypothetical protein
MTIRDLERKTGYTRRYLELLFDQHVGFPPKVIAGIFRFQKFYQLGTNELPHSVFSPPYARRYFPSASPPGPRGPLIGNRTRNRVSPGFDFNSIAP